MKDIVYKVIMDGEIYLETCDEDYATTMAMNLSLEFNKDVYVQGGGVKLCINVN